MTEHLRFIWTARAVRRFLRTGQCEPRHTISNVTADLESPWLQDDFGKQASGAPWILVNEKGDIEARGNLR
jgi:hypothetical protein